MAYVPILAASFLWLAYSCSAGEILTTCSVGGNYSSNSPYKHNLDNVLDTLLKESSNAGFHNFTNGSGSNQVYGSYLCRGDLQPSNCSTCIKASIAIIRGPRCSNHIKGQIWYDECILQYSNESFFGTWQQDYTTWCGYGISVPANAEFKSLVSNTLTEAAKKAAADQTPGRKFGTMEANIDFLYQAPPLYTLAQCVPDLSPDVCLQCLNQSIMNDLPTWCMNTKGNSGWGRTISSSCIIWYAMNKFYNDPVPASPPVASVSVDGSPSTSPATPKGKNIPRILEIVGVSTAAVMLVALGMLWFCLRNRKDVDDFEGINMKDITTAESLQMEFSKVRTANLNFAPDRKLGQGGFGDVYQGTLENGQQIAVKSLTTSDSGQGIAQFKNEVVLIAKLQHRNLVKLLGFCLRAKEKILVYEYLPNSSLDKVLFGMAYVPILAASFLWLAYSCSAGELITTCSEGGSYSSNSTYKDNLDNVLETLSQSSSSTGFYEFSKGSGSDQVYGSYLCRGNYPPSSCSACVKASITKVRGSCTNNMNSQIWDDNCILRYSNESFFGTVQQDYITWCGIEFYVSDDKFKSVLSDTLTKAATKAADDKTPGRKYGTVAANIGILYKFPTLYTLAQCVPDLSPEQCFQCLNRTIITDLPTWCQSVSNGTTSWGRTICSSCTIEYDVKKFYYDDPMPASSPVPSVSVHGSPSTSPAPPPPHPTRPKGKNIPRILEIVGLPTSAVLLVALGMLWFCLRNQKDVDDFEGINMKDITTAESLQMEFSKVRTATMNFAPDRKLGQGGFGDVYLGTLENGQQIAVKRLTTSDSGQGTAQFKNEVVLIAKLQHRNLVKLLGFCLTAKEKILVYEYLPNSSLDKVLFDPIKRASLDWEKRFNIISGIAKGVLYLLEDSRLRIIHRDLKTSNILLDEAMNPKISDFGIAKALGLDQTRASTEILAGTYGYMAPEYLLTGQYSLKSDIYSFGVIVLEIVTGQRTYFGRPLLEETLIYRAWRLWNENDVLEMIDPELNGTFSMEEIVKCIHIGLLCIQEDSGKRPKMGLVVAALSGKSVDLPAPTPPNFFNISRCIDPISGSSAATASTTSDTPLLTDS